MGKKCRDCDSLYDDIDEGKASMMLSKCFPKNGKPCEYLRGSERAFNGLLIKASQPLSEQEPIPDSLKEKTSESQSSGDCNESHTR